MSRRGKAGLINMGAWQQTLDAPQLQGGHNYSGRMTEADYIYSRMRERKKRAPKKITLPTLKCLERFK